MKYIYGLLVAVAIYFMSIGNHDIAQFSLAGVISAVLGFAAYSLILSYVEKKRREEEELSKSNHDAVLQSINESGSKTMNCIVQYSNQIITGIGNLSAKMDEVESNANKRHQEEVEVINEKANSLSKSLEQVMTSLNNINNNQQKSFDTVLNKILEVSNKEMDAVKEFRNSISSEQAKLSQDLNQLICEKNEGCVSMLQDTKSALDNGFSKQGRFNEDLTKSISEKSESHIALINQLQESMQELSNVQQGKVDELGHRISLMQEKSLSDLNNLICEKNKKCESLMQDTKSAFDKGFSEQGRFNEDLTKSISEKSESHIALINQLQESMQELSNVQQGKVDELGHRISLMQEKSLPDLNNLICEKNEKCESLMQDTKSALDNGFSEQGRFNEDLTKSIFEKSESHIALINQLRESMQELSNVQQGKVDNLDKALSERDANKVKLLGDLKSTIVDNSKDCKDKIHTVYSWITETLSEQYKSIMNINTAIEEKTGVVSNVIKNQEVSLQEALVSSVQNQFNSERTKLYESIDRIEHVVQPLQDSVENFDKEISNIKESVQQQGKQFEDLLRSNTEKVNLQVDRIQKIDGDICKATEKAVCTVFADESMKLSSRIDSLQTTYLKVEDQTEELFEKHNDLIDRLNDSFETYKSDTTDTMEAIGNDIEKLKKLVKNVPQDVDDAMSEAKIAILAEFEKHQSAVNENKKSQIELNKVSERLEQVTKKLKR